MYEDEKPSPAPNFIPALLKYKWYALLTGIIFSIIASAVVMSLPPIFRSTGTVVVETQQIPIDLIKSTVTTAASERIEIIKQRVMTREKILEIVNKYPYFKAQNETPMAVSHLLRSVRSNTSIDVIKSGGRRGASHALAFNVSFDSENPFIAQSVANDFVTLFLSENLKIRTERASETTGFLKDEANKIKRELEETETAVALYKQLHKDELPEHLTLYSSMRDGARVRAGELKRDIRATQDRYDFIAAQQSQNSGAGQIQDSALKLAELKNQLALALLAYTPAHPDVKEIQRQIEILESTGSAQDTNPKPALSQEKGVKVSPQLLALKAEIASLSSSLAHETQRVTDMERRILAIPQTERELLALNREYKLKENQYNMLVTKARSAEVAESLEEGRKAERFSIIEPPRQPLSPISPNRIQLLAIGIMASFCFPIGLVLAIGFLNKNIVGRKSLQMVTDIPVISVISHIDTQAEIAAKKQRVIYRLTVIIGVAFLCVIVLHFMYMPITELIPKIVDRLRG